ncbi:AAA domain-containing protein [Pseudonocardia hierapolitana]|uniref:AAA domain-containing protein n=1 Tax=Pseudonocardia hierapolitana TaxID=1128676 RepID=A0A561SL57_9PSEU|nr:AAA domain-containing protein [Pseudonocardia hierapolitana]TWF75608.1 AAA domain-containing protein [Pseudonocardia hierapolitana]
MSANWSADVIADVEQWGAEEGCPAAGWVDLGVAEPREDGLLALARRDRNVDVCDPCLAGEKGPDREQRHPIEELRDEDGLLVLRPPPDLPEHDRHVWVRRAPALDGLLDGLRAAGPAPLAQALVERRLAGPPTSGAEADGLAGAQVEALRACLSPGLRAVWAPPGSGSTDVLTRAIEALLGEGKRVLLVAPSDTAVDEAMDTLVRRMAPEAGVAVRVGDESEELAADASREVDEQRAVVAAELAEIAVIDAEIERLRAELGDYDTVTYRAAAARLDAERDLDELRPRLQEAEAAADRARRAVVDAATELREAVDAQAALGPLREALENERLAIEGLAALEQRQRALRDGRVALDEEARSGGWRERRQHRRQVEAADAELRRFTSVVAEGRRRWLDVQLRARAAIGEHSWAEVDAADRRAAAAERAVSGADEAYRRARELLIGLRRAVEEAEAWGPPTEDDRQLVARKLVSRQARLRELTAWRDASGARRQALDNRERELAERAQALRADAEAEIVGQARVVVTSLARSRVHPALAEADFDVVLVDGAGAAMLAEVLLVLCRATAAAVLFGDSEQTGFATCFSHLGIESAADAEAHEGCVVLQEVGIPEQRHDSPRSPAPDRS